MVCNAILRSFAVNLRACGSPGEGHLKGLVWDLGTRLKVQFPCKHHGFKGVVRMMVDSGAAAETRAVVNVWPEKGHVDGGGYASGGWKR